MISHCWIKVERIGSVDDNTLVYNVECPQIPKVSGKYTVEGNHVPTTKLMSIVSKVIGRSLSAKDVEVVAIDPEKGPPLKPGQSGWKFQLRHEWIAEFVGSTGNDVDQEVY